MKNADLEALLKGRGLPTGGKKADMVERLTKDDDDKKGTGATEIAAAPAAPHPEDEIDWDDDEEAITTDAAKPATESTTGAATTIANAGGEGQIDNPQAVPNQVADIDPSKTDDLSVNGPGEQKENASGNAATEDQKEPPPDYTRGLAASSIDAEIEKRKKRAAKFGLNVEDDEGLKKLERAKKFGESGALKELDEALPERERNRKRGRDTNDEGGRGRDKRRGGGGRFGGRRGGHGPRDDDRRRDNRDSRTEDRNRSDGRSNWMSEADRAKADERKKKWAASAAAS